MQKKWVLLLQNPEQCYQISKKLQISPHIAQILLNRSVTDFESFLNPRLANLSDPFDIPDITKGAKRVIAALEKKENILVYGDYDVDGVTGSAVILETLQYLGANPSHYIPYRYEEGYSLNIEAIKKAKENGTNLIITVDCGISSKKEIELANKLGIDVVVTDHHNIPAELPEAAALVNPKLIKTDHPSKELSGVGVAFKFIWALLRLLNKKDNAFLTGLLDLVALGTIADIVPLQKENRILAAAGLNIINKKKRMGIKQLVEAAALSGDISIRHVNFSLAPRINAAGRLEHASISLNLLRSLDPKEAQDIAEQLNGINKQRQNIGRRIQKEAFEQIELNQMYKNKILILKGDDWHPGVIGIVASQIVDKYYRPTVLISNGRGSARSIDGINVYEILSECRDLFSSFGGHAGAAGFELDPKNYQEFNQRILEKSNKEISDEKLIPSIYIDTELDPSLLTLNNANEIKKLQPFGEGNPVPVFKTKNLVLEEFRLVGTDQKHLKGRFGGFDVIGFDQGHLAEALTLSENYDLVYNLESNEWNGFERIQLNLLDLKPSESK